MVDALRKVDLYGGALTATVPSRMADISDFRPVPDNQEVFGDADIDQSLVIEVLERVEGLDDATCARFFFEDLAQANAADAVDIEHVGALAREAAPCIKEAGSVCFGTQRVAKHHDKGEFANTVEVDVACIRIAEYGTDLLVSVSTPILINAGSSSVATSQCSDEAGRSGRWVIEQFLRSLKLQDYGLFG